VTLANGTATVTAQVTDAYGNQSTLASQAVTVAETLPTVTINPIDGNDIINNAEAHTTEGVALGGTVTGLAQGRPSTSASRTARSPRATRRQSGPAAAGRRRFPRAMR